VKLSSGDVILLEEKYHKRCLTSLYNRVVAHRRRKCRPVEEEWREHVLSVVFAELVSFVCDKNEKDLE